MSSSLKAFFISTSFAVAAMIFNAAPLEAQSQALKSFAYVSNGCTTSPAALLEFDGSGDWKMGSGTGMAPPGSGAFPTGDFYVREISLVLLSGSASTWVIVGHSGSNGDWMTGAARVGEPKDVVFPDDAAPLFTAGEYFDAHTSACDGTISVAIAFWYVPAP